MALGVPAEIVGADLGDASFVNVAGWNKSGCDEISEPLRCIGINLVVIGGHAHDVCWLHISTNRPCCERRGHPASP
jgi:hypothetical protein